MNTPDDSNDIQDAEVIDVNPIKIPEGSFSLTIKQQRFIEAYKKLGDATKSAISAGYSAKSAHVEANRLLKNPKILEAIKQYKLARNSMISKDDYALKALDTFEKLDITEPNSPRFYDIAGKALGYIGNNSDSRPNITNNIQLNKIEVNALPPNKKWDALRSMLEGE